MHNKKRKRFYNFKELMRIQSAFMLQNVSEKEFSRQLGFDDYWYTNLAKRHNLIRSKDLGKFKNKKS